MAQSPLTDEFNGWVREKLEAWKVPGMSLAIVDGDDIFTQGYGYATLPDVEATPDSLYYGASTTKAMVAATLSHMIDSKKYPQLAAGWDTKFSSLIRDDFVLQDEWATNHLTLEDAVCHRTGMPRYDKSLAHRVDGREATCRDVVRNFRNLSLNAEPRTTFQYCNIMYIALGHAIEAVSGKSLGDMMKEVIWGPLGMKSTYLSLDDVEKAPEHFSAGYYWDKKAEQFKEVPPMEIGEDAAPGGVISTVADYARWVKCLLDEAAPFSSNAHKDMRKPRILATTEPAKGADLSTYGLGWFRNVYKGHDMYSHSGGMHAFGAQVYWFPGAKFGAIALGNTAWTSNAVEDTVLFRLIDEKLGIPESDRFDFEKSWRDAIQTLKGDVEDPVKSVFPDISEPPLPPTFTTSELAGRYSDPGYGEIRLVEEAHPEKPDEKILVANRDEMTWPYKMLVSHATGDYWVVNVITHRNPTLVNDFQAGKFIRGVGGKVSALSITWGGYMSDSDGETTFKRVD